MNVVDQLQFSQSLLKCVYGHQENRTVNNELVDDLFGILRCCNHDQCLAALKSSLRELLSCGNVAFNPITQEFESDGDLMALHIYNILYWLCSTPKPAPSAQIQTVAAAAETIIRKIGYYFA